MPVNAVATTGIYCRPGCSARPNPENVAGFASPVAAEAAGYRSCLRCRPDRHLAGGMVGSDAPGAVVAALGLISDGYLDRFDEDALADRVGYSTRQLRRLFEHHVGATPAFVARSRRAHFARRLLDETDLPMTAVAGASGFGSVRQMSRVVAGVFGFPPGELRRRRRPGDVLVADGGLRLGLPLVEPLDRAGLLTHLRTRAVEGLELVTATSYRRTLVTCGNPGVLEISLGGGPGRDDGPTPGTGSGRLTVTAHLPTFGSVIDDVARVRHMLGLDDDLVPATRHLAADPLLGPLVAARPGTRVAGGWDRFETAVRVVIGQQVSVAGAATTTARLVRQRGVALRAPALGLRYVFPTADRLVDLTSADAGMPAARVRTIAALSAAVIDGRVDLSATPADLRVALLELPGIGPWTAELVAMRAARDADAFPAADLGIRRALGRLLDVDGPVSAQRAAGLAEAWRPHRALAAQLLWTSLHPPLHSPTTKESPCPTRALVAAGSSTPRSAA